MSSGVMQVLMATSYPDDVPSCCLSSISAGMFAGSCGTTSPPPTTPCWGKQVALAVGVKVELQCSPPDMDYMQAPEGCYAYDATCPAPCSMQAVAINGSTWQPLGVVLKANGEAISLESDLPSTLPITSDMLSNVNANYILKMTCSAMMYQNGPPEDTCSKDMGPLVCSDTNRPSFMQLIQTQEDMMKLENAGECSFGLGLASNDVSDDSTCAMLNLNPSRMMYFLCGLSQGGQYCGDWVGNPDGQNSNCHHDNYESCKLTNGPVKIHEAECANEAFKTKFVRGSEENPHCGPLLRGGCCVASMFLALTDDDEASMWPLCVRTWVTQTCGVDLSSPCTNDGVEQTLVVEVTITIDITARRLGDLNTTECTDHGAKLLSTRLNAALLKTSAEAGAAGARPLVISDSACGSGTGDRQIVTDFVLQGSNGITRFTTVAVAVESEEFSLHLKEEGVEFKDISVRTTGSSTSTSGPSSTSASAITTLSTASNSPSQEITGTSGPSSTTLSTASNAPSRESFCFRRVVAATMATAVLMALVVDT
jgi:hypothetical protein